VATKQNKTTIQAFFLRLHLEYRSYKKELYHLPNLIAFPPLTVNTILDWTGRINNLLTALLASCHVLNL
jgi:hypothetical protein